MLELKNIDKIYKTSGFRQQALDNISVNFRKNEFASILGPSGSGKTTLLNIIGGLDHYTSGNLIVNEVSTKNFSDRDWDSYRNHRVGFIFQSYNLIGHQTILRNVELALTLSGCSRDERRKKAIKALTDVGLKKHINKKPNQLSGGQMQRVAIARALINDPEIILADEPTGALDSETSLQIMSILKDISKDRLVIMVTHNPELAKEYSSRIINIKDGKIISDSNPYDGKIDTSENKSLSALKKKKTKMSFLTALFLSFNNLMTKKGRTILVSLAGSIGIIGIALILAVSTGFQNYVDSIQEDTLKSYPLTIMEESSDIASVLLSMTDDNSEGASGNEVLEHQYIGSMLSSVSKNDMYSLKQYIDSNYDKIQNDLDNVQYSYSVEPNVYTIDATKKLAKLNPSNLFSSMMGTSSLMQSYSAMNSVYSQIVDNLDGVKNSYDVLVGRWPEAYNELIIVLPDKNSISDLLVYSLGLRDTEELSNMVNKIMDGEEVDIKNEPLKFTYDDLMNVDLRLIMASDTYKYNKKYDVYEDMSDDKDYMNKLYDNALKLKVVGVVTTKEGSSSMALNTGVLYTSDLTKYIINYAKDTDIVKKQLKNKDVDVFSGNKFDSKENDYDFQFSDLVKVDSKKLQSAFGSKVNKKSIEKTTNDYINKINDSLTADTSKAKKDFSNNLNTFLNGVLDSISGSFDGSDVDNIVSSYLDKESSKLNDLEKNYIIPAYTFKVTYSTLLKGYLNAYIAGYNASCSTLGISCDNVLVNDTVKSLVLNEYLNNGIVIETINKMASVMTETVMKRDVLSKVGELTYKVSSSIASSFNVDQNKIASAFTLNFSENELSRVVSAMMNKTVTTQKSNLSSLGYQDLESPTYISFYFNSFDGKEHFISFLDEYNNTHDEDHQINYTDTTGILISSVKTIVNAVSYVLIAFVSISLVVSSIMIGVITYISVYERTKEIGILRAIGASKRNISSIFNAETFIIGLLSGLFGIGICYILIPIINKILHHFAGSIPLRAMLSVKSAIILVILSIILTLIGGLIPSKSASRKDPVEALRSE